jgi:hypothetical protein
LRGWRATSLAITVAFLGASCYPPSARTFDFPILGPITKAEIYSPAIYNPPIVVIDSAMLRRLVRSINNNRRDSRRLPMH